MQSNYTFIIYYSSWTILSFLRIQFGIFQLIFKLSVIEGILQN